MDNAKSLGDIIDKKLNWDEQFRCTKSKTSGCLAALKKLKNIISQSQLCNVYCALIESQLRYTKVILGCLSETKRAALQRLQD